MVLRNDGTNKKYCILALPGANELSESVFQGLPPYETFKWFLARLYHIDNDKLADPGSPKLKKVF